MKLLVAILLALPVHALACSCVGFSDEEAYSSHYNVFIGKLTEIRIHDSQYATGYLEPIFVAKGKVGTASPLKVGGSMCSYIEMLEPNALYLVYGKEGMEASLGQCTATRKVSKGNLDAAIEMLLKFKVNANKSLKSDAASGAL